MSNHYETMTQYQRGITRKQPLFLIHAASGLSLPYFGMYPLDRPVYGITNPYFNEPVNKPNRREFKCMKTMARAYLRMIRRVQPRGPYLLGGWSFGGVLALEVARQLIGLDEVVSHVVLLDSAHLPGYKFPVEYNYVLVDALLSRSEGLDPDTCAKIRESYRNSQYLMGQHATAPYHGKVTLIRSTVYDESIPMPAVEEELERKVVESTDNCWGDRLSNLNVLDIPVSHDSLFDPEYVEQTSNLLRDALAELP
ncbi:hypothetical protein H4R33_001359 [Dimargaris cristalligena]|uniref:Alpha/Beta hydrolase protein n=1 Tax=Dimargaris cristalligena TaxID=215637 RepID=A0A4P9ZWU6_9FUNG|nr:hypothetical protein H4R33_001359 [Dimargaris cristalligena]RKP37818.1 Alpha/Beta hydrolase protein [Dimargaris cristalligena]|eukprot:RKP37818.1 Alpha/Beta hydrolase protein [Dimargaris cristalligena]